MKNILISIFALAFSMTAHAASLADTSAAEFLVNHGSVGSFAKIQLGTSLMKSREHSLKCVYDFSVQGGAIGTLNLLDVVGKPCVLPNKAIIRDVLIDAVTTLTSGGSAVVGLSSGKTAGDMKANATAFSAYTGLVAGVPVGTAATAIKLTADVKPTITIATAALTAGKLNVHIKYQISE
jgi:hypothetical protein